MAITLNGSTGVTAAEFDGALDASNLTGDIDASQLTGALPAIDGSALTGIDTAPPTTLGAVGTYAVAITLASAGNITVGATTSGSNLVGVDNSGSGWNAWAGTYSGTWRNMGINRMSSVTNENLGVWNAWLRIS